VCMVVFLQPALALGLARVLLRIGHEATVGPWLVVEGWHGWGWSQLLQAALAQLTLKKSA